MVFPKQGAFDNTLAVSETNTHFKTAFGYEEYAIQDQYVYSKWQPYNGCSIKNFIVPHYPWHLHIHQIDTNREINLLAGSFSAPADGKILETTADTIRYCSSVGTTALKSFTPGMQCELSMPEPNTNLLFERTVLLLATLHLEPGKYTVIYACLGDPNMTLFLHSRMLHSAGVY